MLQFPVLIGQGWPKRSQQGSTITQTAQSGLSIRTPNYIQTKYSWDVPFGYLNDDLRVATADWQILWGFYELNLAKWQLFLFDDPSDDDTSQYVNPATPTPSTIGIGDGTTTTFQLARTMGGASHLIYHVNSANRAPRIYLNGTLSGSGYTISSTGLVTFGSAPGGGVTVAWDGQFFYGVHFKEDSIEDEQIGPFHVLKSVALQEDRI